MIAIVTAQGTGSALVLALAAWGSAMLLSGLLAAHYRVSGLFRNGLLEDRPLGAALNNYLAHDRRFQVTIGALYLGCSLVGGWTLGRLLEAVWAGAGGVRFLVVFGIGATLIWTLGGLLLRSLAAGAALGYARGRHHRLSVVLAVAAMGCVDARDHGPGRRHPVVGGHAAAPVDRRDPQPDERRG